MKTRLLLTLTALLTLARVVCGQGTAFTYNGQLNDNGAPANGNYDLRFTIYDSDVGVNLVAGPLLVTPVAVANGLFSVRVDFGAGVFTGPARWLEISVRPVGVGDFTTLAPRQELTSSPYAIHAASAGTAADVANGSVVKSLNNLRDDLTLAAGANVTITPNGNTLTLAAAGAGGSGIWSVNGNNAYYNAGNVGIGTITPQSALDVNGNIIIRGTESFGASTRQMISLYDSGVNSTFGIGVQDAAFYQRCGTGSGFAWFYGGVHNNGQYNPGTGGTTLMILTGTGRLGIGSTTPQAQLEVVGQDALRLVGYNPFLTILDSNAGYARSRIQGVAGDLNLFTESYLSGANPFSFLKLANSGNVGIGSATPVGKLEVVAQDALRLVGYQPFLTLLDSNAGYARSRIQGVNGELFFAMEGYMNGSSPNGWAKLNGAGNMSVATLTIRGGADLAEPFDLSTAEIAKGSVVVIDPENPGKLKLSDEPYDRRVAGVVSGAHGINPGISLRQQGDLDGAENVALSGRVYVLADATHGAIKPGDLLTTSDTPGHTMKVTDHATAQGAILGKAMSGLKEGKGMVLALVTLQ